MRALLVAVVLLAGCGAKSALEVSAPAPIDASRPDARPFDTFTCRWSYAGPPVLLAELDHEPALFRASLHPDHDVGVVTLGRGSPIATPPGRFVAFTLEGETVGMQLPGDPIGAFPRGDGWALVHGPGCSVSTAALDLATVADATAILDTRCDADSIGDRIALVSQAFDLEVHTIPRDPPFAASAVTTVITRDARGRAALATDGTLWMTVPRWAGIGEQRLLALPTGGSIHELPRFVMRVGLMPLAPDRLRGGVIVVAPGRETIVLRAFVEGGEIVTEELASLDTGTVTTFDAASTESEILLGREDGSLFSVPMSGAAVHDLEAPEPRVVDAAFAIREGTSAGAVVYTTRGGRTVMDLKMRPLACNR